MNKLSSCHHTAFLDAALDNYKYTKNIKGQTCKPKYENIIYPAPFVVSTDGMLGREANFILKRLAQSISIKWDKPLGHTIEGWLHSNLSFAILQAMKLLCLHGSSTKWRSGVGIDYGAGLPTELSKSN